MSLNWTGAQRQATPGWQMNTNVLYIIYKNRKSVFHRYHRCIRTVFVLCSKSTSCTSYPTLNILQRRIQDIQIKPGQSSSTAECQRDTDVKWKTKQSLSALEIVLKARIFTGPCWYVNSRAAAAQQPRRIVPGSNQSLHHKQSKPGGEDRANRQVTKHVSQRIQKLIRENKWLNNF